MNIVTAGPNVFKEGVITELCKKGLEVIRISSSKQPPMDQIERILPELDENVKLIVDFPGGKHRLNNPGNFKVKKGEVLRISKNESTYDYKEGLSIYPKIKHKMKTGEVLIIGDGETAFSIVEENDQEIIVQVERDASLGPRKGITPSNIEIKYDIFTEIDYKNMECLSEEIISGVMISFVEKAEDIKSVRDFIREKFSRDIEIYAKIETEKGIHNVEDISTEADYVVLGRGDLLITTGEIKFPILQQRFLDKMKEKSKKTIIATELAHSVANSYLMSRSELSFLYLIGQMGYKNLMFATETTVLCDPIFVFEKVSGLIEQYSLKDQKSLHGDYSM
ncbi:pyruvate kinase (plasmid) [Bacillus sp. ZJS3]|uniref:pyruvate kinase n=1 Tax=Bacillus sp. ZJS3 TaxID=2928154 RepID=UPI001FB3FD4C|nr:pyruvate kinase [Bacillus sp. ZJS3]UOB81935.1 pyruvate kinase [Bacillus sp. ZJS3]